MTDFIYRLKEPFKGKREGTVIGSWNKEEEEFLSNPKNAVKVFFDGAESVPKKYLELLKSEGFFELITEQELDKKIVGEINTRKTIFLVAQSNLVINKAPTSANLCINDESGVGKDYIAANTLSILPKKSVIKRTRISPTALTYWHQKKFEPEWSWDNIRLYLEDVSEGVYNSPVFKVYASGETSSTIVINQQAIDIEIIGKPSLFVTFAATEPNPELLRRFPLLNVDSSTDQTKAIMKRHAEFATAGTSMEFNQEITKALNYLKPVKVKVPFAEKIVEHFPIESTIMRTQFPRFLDYVKFATAFHQFQRETDEEGFLLSVGRDYDLARLALLETTSNQFMIPLTKNQKRILEKLEPLKDSSFYFADISAKVNFLSQTTLWENVTKLCDYGFLEKSTKKEEKVDKPFTIYNYIGTKAVKIPEWKELGIDE